MTFAEFGPWSVHSIALICFNCDSHYKHYKQSLFW